MEMTIHLTGVDTLAEAVKALTAVLASQGGAACTAATAPLVAAQFAAVQAPVQSVAAPATAAVPVETPSQSAAAAAAAVVPVAATPTYTLEQLSLAARQLVDVGGMPAVQELVAQFGVQSIAQLPQDKYGEFATALRGRGAKI